MIMKAHTFVSYAHENRRFALKISRQLQQHDVLVWLDQWNVDVSDEIEWDREIRQSIDQCETFLLILSPAALNSWLIQEQFLRAVRFQKKIILVMYQACPIPEALVEFPVVNFSDKRYGVALEELLAQFLPNQKIQVDPLGKILTTWQQLDWAWWHRLRPLLWPGWLGPVIVVICFTIGWILFHWNVEQQDSPQIERLTTITHIIPPTPSVQFQIRSIDKMELIYIPSGEFFMGSITNDPLAEKDEWPRHPVFVDSFWIDKTEITNHQYRLCVASGVCEAPFEQRNSFFQDDLPVVGVDWFQSQAYCEWVGGRLPTEAEWEKAARGTDSRIYPWGNEFDGTRLNSCDKNCIQDWKDVRWDDGYKYTAPVGSYPDGASPYGILDMSGNVWEWTNDWYAEDYYVDAPYRNPMGPMDGVQRVIRGGSWHYSGRNLRAVNRHKDTPTFRYDKIGFRCVLPENSAISDSSSLVR